MTTVLFTLIVFPFVLALYLYYLAGLTRGAGPTVLRALRNTQAGGILYVLESPSHVRTLKKMDRLWRRDFSSDYMRRVMPDLFGEAQRAALAARRFAALWHFGLFCLAYGLVWSKVRVWAEVEDLRYLLGAEANVLRAARAAR